mmetsp:Transcript_49235/g.73245  ORF Transcript_49235/g.73245 Transcript_49235/m.73245 type:complete len:455 (-) Transcript_49235:563-1927(-)
MLQLFCNAHTQKWWCRASLARVNVQRWTTTSLVVAARANLWQSLHGLREGAVVGGAQTGGGIPASDRLEAVAANATTRVLAVGDVVERLGVLVDERVQESEGGLAGGKADAVELGEDGGGDRARSAGAGDSLSHTVNLDAVGVALAAESGHIGVTTAGVVPHLLRGQVSRRVGLVLGDNIRLEVGNVEVVRETAATISPGLFVADHALLKEVSAADSRDVGARCGEVGVELVLDEPTALAAADALVTGGEQDGEAAGAKLHELGGATEDVLGTSLLGLVVAVGHRVHQRSGLVVAETSGPVEEGVLGLVVEGEGNFRRECTDVLYIEHGLDATFLLILAHDVVHRDVDVAALTELGEVLVVVVLALELSNGEGVALGHRVVGVRDVVALVQDSRVDAILASRAEAGARVGPVVVAVAAERVALDAANLVDSGDANEVANEADDISDLLREGVSL